MNSKNERRAFLAGNDAPNTKMKTRLQNQSNPNQPNFQAAKTPSITVKVIDGQNEARPHFCFIGMRIVCDECAAPLHLYGENFIETYTDGRVNILRCLCDIHADELEVNA